MVHAAVLKRLTGVRISDRRPTGSSASTLLGKLRDRLRYRVQRKLFRKSHSNLHSGEFQSFEEARAALPRDGVVGYDNAELAGWYRERLDRVQSEDYPVLFWLQRLLADLETVFDFGGHIGLHFYAWRKLVDLPLELKWQVCEVDAVAQAGRALASEREVASLGFTTEPGDADGASVFLASGSLQYLEPGFLWRTLRALARRPRYLLLNKLPVHPFVDFVTVQDTGASFHPYTVVARSTLEGELARLGYRKLDGWTTPGFSCLVSRRRDLDVTAYSGGCWALQSGLGLSG